jgi:hypothetical protein
VSVHKRKCMFENLLWSILVEGFHHKKLGEVESAGLPSSLKAINPPII